MTTTRIATPADEAGEAANVIALAGDLHPHYSITQEQAKKLLEALGLGREGLIEVKCINPGQQPRMFWYASVDALLSDWAKLEKLNRAGWHVYYGVASFKSDSGTKDNIAHLLTVHGDLDGKDFVDDAADWARGKEIAKGALEILPATLRPSALVDSGHGYHAYWFLREPLPATPENIAAVEAVNTAIAVYLDSDPAVKDASRVLRLPGFNNVKQADPLPVVLYYCHGRCFDLADFAKIMPEPKAAPATVTAKAASTGDGPRPGDDFNTRGNWANLLTSYGWSEAGKKGETSYWCRPGKKGGISARLNHNGDGLLYVFSSSAAPLEANESYSLFGAYATLKHRRDFNAATKALAAEGYGTPRETTTATTHANGTDPHAGAEPANEPAAVSLPKTTHGANGRRFVDKHRGQAVYNMTSNRWMVYDGTRWAIDEARTVQTWAKGIVFDMYMELPSISEDDVRKAMATWARRSDSPTGTDAILSEAANSLNLTDSVLDTDPRLFNVMNGTFDLEAGRLLPHDPRHMISKLAPVFYDPDATCPTYDQAILDIFSGDADTVRFFEEAAGATLSGKASKNMIFMLGDLGDNGKSTVANMLLDLFGDYGLKGDLSLLVRGDRFDPLRANPTVVSLKGRRFVVVQEVPKDRSMDEGQVKELTGRDVLSARRLHENPVTFAPSHLLWVYGNHRLKVDDSVVFNRLFEIPFNVEFPDGDPRRDEGMPEKLRAELSGIFNRFLAGYRRFVANGEQLRPSHQVKAATASYRAESNTVLRYINERFEIMRDAFGDPDPAYTIGATELYHGYKAFCNANDLKDEYTQNLFGRMITRLGYPSDQKRTPGRPGLRRLSDDEIEARANGEDAPNEAPKF